MIPRQLTLLAMLAFAAPSAPASAAQDFDHDYAAYSALLQRHLHGARVDYASLKADRADLDRVVTVLGGVTAAAEASWSTPQRLAYWINAYNVFTLRAIVDHYPIKGSWFSLYPKNSIRQISGVWTELRWRAGGRDVTLDEIEHQILRPMFREPRVHFAINCASVGCPPLAARPYRAGTLDEQLDEAASRYLTMPSGLVVDGETLRLSSIFKWFGIDFEPRYAASGPDDRTGVDRALLGVILRHGPPAARDLARRPGVRISYLDYDWSLNDTATAATR